MNSGFADSCLALAIDHSFYTEGPHRQEMFVRVTALRVGQRIANSFTDSVGAFTTTQSNCWASCV
jgi:hypothetical protein